MVVGFGCGVTLADLEEYIEIYRNGAVYEQNILLPGVVNSFFFELGMCDATNLHHTCKIADCIMTCD